MTKKFINKTNIYHFGLDELEHFGTFKHEDLFIWLDFDNSNYAEFLDFILTKHEVPKYKYKIVFTYNNYTVFAYYKWDQDRKIKTLDYICIYATWIRIFWPKYIYSFIKNNFNLSHIRRFDICLDVKLEIKK